MKLSILGSGTSQGIPVIACGCDVCTSKDPKDKRLRSSVMIEMGGKRLIIDAGPDFRYQMLRADVKDIRAILLTHEHKDHIGGLDDVRAFNWVKKSAIDIYGNHRTLEVVRKDFAYAFSEYRYPGVPEFQLHEVAEAPFHVDDIEIIPIPVVHYKLPVLGFRIGKFAYITDTNCIPEASVKKLEGVEYLVINALRKETHLSHFTLREAIDVAEKLNVKHAWLTHVGHQMGKYADVSLELPPNVSLAFDGMEMEFTC